VTGQEQLRSIDGETADPESSRPLRGALAYTFDGVLTMNPCAVRRATFVIERPS
jgi:hypothetical protein